MTFSNRVWGFGLVGYKKGNFSGFTLYKLKVAGIVLSCLPRGTANKIDGSQSTGANHPWFSMAPGNKFDLASVSSEPVRRRSQMLMQLLGEVNVVYDYRFCIGLSGLIS